MAVLATTAVGLRMGCKRHLRYPVSGDDYLIFLSLILALGLCAMLILCAHFGSGRHIDELDIDTITKFLKVQWAFEFVYSITITTVKLSVLLFYHRMFPNSATTLKFKIGLYGLAAVSVVLGLGTFIAVVFECDLTTLYWDRTSYGLCINMKAFLLSMAILNLFTDVLILILPISVVWELQIKKSQKVAISGMFLLGGFVCLSSIVRTCFVGKVDIDDPTWTAVDADIWSTVEPSIGIVSACLPMMGPLLKGIVPSRLRNVKSPFRPISSFGSSVGRQKEKNKGIRLVEDRGGKFDRLDDSASASKGSVSVDVYPFDVV
ncbi:hypothetical protein HO133_004294 [Letharia lupina]|uniref:Rhodopsin domain-containing protein n=1 Tax=Letharia lupina TaxID=560253 RepID=A0A8H6FK29_9LECA|nr:uncharacterized protein HO133_004294 [Letharia lupina]KAF6229956.1 hypothetical protein HO133_004294 [Letharia lupina]